MKLKLKESDIQKTIIGSAFSKKEKPVVFFYDYDGTLLYSYSKREFFNLDGMPSLPNRLSENLVGDGWNWSFNEINDYLNTLDGDVNVGAIYHTDDYKTHITCKPIETFPQAYINLVPTVANAVSVDWGDGSAVETWTTANVNEIKSHTYTGVTESSIYDITISCTSGTYRIPGYFTGSQANNKCCVYTNIKVSNKVTGFDSYCFNSCYFLQYITIPNGVENINSYCFQYCYALQSINIPTNIYALTLSCFEKCYALQHITMPKDIKNGIWYGCFLNCLSLRSITIPNIITGPIGQSMFSGCRSLQYVTIPHKFRNIPVGMFGSCYSLEHITISNGATAIENSTFNSCYNLKSVIIPNSVTSIGAGVISSSSYLQKIYMKPTTPPELGGTLNSNDNLVIYVPRGTLSAYQNATNWSSHASKMVEYDY